MPIEQIIKKNCPDEELAKLPDVVIDYTFRVKEGVQEPYILVSIGNWRGKSRLKEFKKREFAARDINSAAAMARKAVDSRLRKYYAETSHFYDARDVPQLRIICYYKRGSNDGAILCENWPGE